MPINNNLKAIIIALTFNNLLSGNISLRTTNTGSRGLLFSNIYNKQQEVKGLVYSLIK